MVGAVEVFFFKHKTAYEMRISDWSSDVCSSDLREKHLAVGANIERALAVDEEASLEVGVRVLREELAARGLGLWTIRLDADDVDADEAVTRVERVDFVLISGDHFILAGIRRERLIRFPALEFDADRSELIADRSEVGIDAERRARLAV